MHFPPKKFRGKGVFTDGFQGEKHVSDELQHLPLSLKGQKVLKFFGDRKWGQRFKWAKRNMSKKVLFFASPAKWMKMGWRMIQFFWGGTLGTFFEKFHFFKIWTVLVLAVGTVLGQSGQNRQTKGQKERRKCWFLSCFFTIVSEDALKCVQGSDFVWGGSLGTFVKICTFYKGLYVLIISY